MIAITMNDGTLLRGGLPLDGRRFGFHRIFGFISEAACSDRAMRRERAGLPSYREEWLCRFTLEAADGNSTPWRVADVENAKSEQLADGTWKLLTDFGNFLISDRSEVDDGRVTGAAARPVNSVRPALLLAVLFLLLFYFLVPKGAVEVVAPILEPVLVKISPEVQKPVPVRETSFTKVTDAVAKKNVQGKRAIEQNLGFLKMLGKKDLTKALGSVPTKLQDASPGAGAGGKAGSGGELLIGLGEGVKRTTVGNTGVAGLGGVGKSGAGGGAGGYGTSLLGSGEGRALSSLSVGVPLSRDVELEGGLDRSVIQATIAKYLSQVRACYELGLQRNPGIAGTVSMKFEIGGEGQVNAANVGKSSLGDTSVEQCISEKMLGWKFPKPLGGVSVKVAYPFLLRPVNS